MRERVARAGQQLASALEGEIEQTGPVETYQRAMGFVYDTLGPQAAEDVVRAAVLNARKVGSSPLSTATEHDGTARDWQITRGVKDLAHLMHVDPVRFPGPIFTTNFDPLIELALRDRGFAARTQSIPLDGSIAASVKSSTTDVDVFHAHGFWRDSATLHRPQQLTAARPQLRQSLQRHLDGTHLVVMAYSGWDDIFTTAIANCLSDIGFRGQVSWCFFEADPAVAEVKNAALFDKFANGIAQGKIAFFRGIDCHTFFRDLVAALDLTPAVQAAIDGSPMPGWQLVSPTMLDKLLPLTNGEAVRFFDGAVPTLRHATSPLVPVLSHVEPLAVRLAHPAAGGCGMQLLRGAGGEGKSTVLLQAAVQAARSGAWSVLYRPAIDAGLNVEAVVQLDPARKWLIVADDAEELIDDIWSAAEQLHRKGRQNVIFLLAARDADWRAKGGDARGWSTLLGKSEDVVLSGIDLSDAALVVDAWTTHGDHGLRALSDIGTREGRVAGLVQAAKAQDLRRGQGSFFGGLLDTRFGAAGLVDHLLPALDALRQRPIEGGTATLFDALLHIANCHATGMVGLDNRVLAKLCGVPVYRVAYAIVAPLGREVGAATSRGHVLTRHRQVAEAIVVAADRMGTDLRTTWRQIVEATVAVSKQDRIGETYSPIVLAGARLMRDLPQTLDEDLRGDIGIVAAETAMAAVPEWTGVISAMANALRSAGYPQEAYELLRKKVRTLGNTVDKAKNVRGYFYEWSTCAGRLPGRRWSIIDAWLACLSLSDTLPVEVTFEQAKMTCAGLGTVMNRLDDGKPAGVYAKARRAVVHLGWQSKPDARATGYFKEYQSVLETNGTPKPTGNDQAVSWLVDAALSAWQELDDDFIRRLVKDGRLTFKRLSTRLEAR